MRPRFKPFGVRGPQLAVNPARTFLSSSVISDAFFNASWQARPGRFGSSVFRLCCVFAGRASCVAIRIKQTILVVQQTVCLVRVLFCAILRNRYPRDQTTSQDGR
jgi:hypothetical protein